MTRALRLSPFPVLALLLGALSLFAAAPAKAQTTIWSATLTVHEHPLVNRNEFGCTSQQNSIDDCRVRLTTDNLRVEGNLIFVRTLLIEENNDRLIFAIEEESGFDEQNIGPGLGTDWRRLTLHIGGQSFPLADGEERSSRHVWWFGSPGISWTDGQQIQVSLTAREVSLSASPNPAPEGDSVTVTATLSEALSSAVAIPVTVSTAAPNTAESGDVGTLTSIAIPAGQTSGTGSVSTNQDTDADDETFTVALGTTLPARVGRGRSSSVRVSIADDDGRPKLRLSASPNPVAEGSPVTLTATLSEALARSLSVPLTLTRDTAEFRDVGRALHITIPAGQTSATGTISTNHDADTDDETFTVSIDSLTATDVVLGAPSSATVTIDDDDTAVSLFVSHSVIGETDKTTATKTAARSGVKSATLTAILSEPLASDATLPLIVKRVTAEAGDYVVPTFLTIAAGENSGSVQFTAQDDADNEDELVRVSFGPLPARLRIGGGASSVEILIDDAQDSSVSLLSVEPVLEGGSVTVTARLSSLFLTAKTFPLTVTAVTAESGDYDPPSPASITIPADRSTGTLTIQTNQDADEDDETFTVALGTLPSLITAGSQTSVVVTIVDEAGLPTVSLSAPSQVGEGSSVAVTATLDAALDAAVTIPLRYGGAADTAESGDYETPEGILIAAGATSGQVNVRTKGDMEDEGRERFTVSLDTANMPPVVSAGSPASVEIDILEGSNTVTLRAIDTSVAEGDEAEFILLLSRPAPAPSDGVDNDILVRVTGITTEHDPDEYEDVAETTILVRVPAGETSAEFTVQTYRDTDADDERFRVHLEEDDQYGWLTWLTIGSPSSAEITIEDDAEETGSVYVSLSAAGKVKEGSSLEVTVNLSAPAPVNPWEEITIPVYVTGIDTEPGDVHAGLHARRIGGSRTLSTWYVGTAIDKDTDDERFTVSIDTDNLPAGVSAGNPTSLEITIEDKLAGLPGLSGLSGAKSSAPNVAEPPGAPLGLTAAGIGPDRIELGWTAPSDIGARLDGYQVQYRRAEGPETGEWTDHGHAGASIGAEIAGLDAHSAYELRVRSLGDGESEWATAAARTTVAAPALVGEMPDLTLMAGGRDVALDAAAALTGEDLSFAFVSSDASVASFDGAAEAANGGSTAQLRAESAGSARITVTAANPGGAASVTFAVAVKAVSDEEAEALGLSLDGLTRSLLSGATGIIDARMAASENEAQALSELKDIDALATLSGLLGLPVTASGPAAPSGPAGGGWALPESGAAVAPWTGAGFDAGQGHASGGSMEPPGGMLYRNAMPPGNGPDALGAAPQSSVSGGGLAVGGNLWNRSFAFSLAPGAGQARGGRAPAPLSGLTVWGLGDAQNFSGGEGASRFDGEWRTAYLGADRWFGERWLGGVALARGRGEANYAFAGDAPGAGRLATDLTAVYPYVRGVFAGGTELWAMLGAGSGAATLYRNGAEGDVPRGDLGMRLGAAGLRHALANFDAVRVSVLADIGAATLDVDGEAALAELESAAHRARAGLEVAGTGRFSPYLRVNARYDGGGDMAEAGYEGEAGLRYAGARMDFELRGRWMALAGDADYRESGATATFTVKAAPDGTGLFASFTPSWGRPGTSNFVWGQGAMPAMDPTRATAAADPGMTFNAELGYGIESWRLRGKLTPTLGFQRMGPAGDTLRFGAAYAANPKWLRRELSIGLGMQRQRTFEGPAWGVVLQTRMRW